MQRGASNRETVSTVARRDVFKVMLSSGPVSGLTSEKIHVHLPSHADRHSGVVGGLTRLPLRGQCQVFTGFPFHPVV